MGFGGVEKAVANEANILCEFCETEIISAYKLYDTPPFELDSRVKVRYLFDCGPNKEEFKAALSSKNPLAVMREGVKAAKLLRGRTSLMKKALRQCDSDVIISTRVLYNKILSDFAPKKAVKIAQEHCHHNGNEKYIAEVTSSVKELDYFMPVSQELTSFYAERLAGEKVKCRYIPHNLDSWADKLPEEREKILTSVGRLSPEKGYTDLIDVFALINREMPEYTLHIVGDGGERSAVEEKIKAHGLEKSVVLCGYQKKDFINPLLSRSALYLMGSLEESFGIVLIEAQSYGVPCVAFSSARGACEIINDGENGYLIDGRDKKLFAEKVCELLRDDEKRRSFSLKSRENAEAYKKENVAALWKEFFAELF